MTAIQRIRLIIGLIILIITALSALAIWQSSQPPQAPAPIAGQAALGADASKTKPNSKTQASIKAQSLPAKPNANYPIPAKKLHSLVTQQTTPTTQQDLDKQTAALNQQLQSLDAQLKAKGINVPTQAKADSAARADTQKRLQAIQQHMASKSP